MKRRRHIPELKRIVADKELQIQALKELGGETGEPGSAADT
jgi:hypothetical protein